MRKVIIEKVELSQLEELRDILMLTFSEAFSEQNTAEDMRKYLDESFNIVKVHDELSNPESAFYIARKEGQIIGYLKLNFGSAQTVKNDPHSVEIERIYVLKSFYGKNVGQALLNWALQKTKEKKAPYIWLGVWENNPRAIRFYQKNGFVEYDKHVFLLGNDEQTDLLMKLKFD